MLPTLTAPEIVPRNRTGTDSFANANATTTAPQAKLVTAAIAVKAAIGKGARKSVAQPAEATMAPPR
jgi:hypothetical protein